MLSGVCAMICIVYKGNCNMRLAVMGVHTLLSLLSVILLAIVYKHSVLYTGI